MGFESTLFTNTDEWMAEHSYVNCHAVGLHSIMFDNTPGQKLRLFIARGEMHDLWKNRVPLSEPMSVAIHTHHCNVNLIPVSGAIYNVTIQRHDQPGPTRRHILRSYKYDSAIRSGQIAFRKTGEILSRLSMELLTTPRFLPAHERHSIYVEKGKDAAWFVEEGDEDEFYDSTCYSNQALDECDFSALYQPMTVPILRTLLDGIGLYRRGS